MHFRNVLFVALVCAMAAFAQTPITADSPFQVRYAANLLAGESYIDIVNTGANGAYHLGPGYVGGGFGLQVGNICVNVYAFSPDEQLVSCCSCFLTPNAVANLGVARDLTSKTLTGALPPSVVVKLLGTLAGDGSKTKCDNSAALAGTAAFPLLTKGMAAWGTTLHQAPAGSNALFHTTETAFTPATLNGTGADGSDTELSSIIGRCASILGNGSTFGICASCRAGALGGVKK